MAGAAPKHPEADGRLISLSVSCSFAPTQPRHRVSHIRGAQRTQQVCTRMTAGPETPINLGWARVIWGLQNQFLARLGRTASLPRPPATERKISAADGSCYVSAPSRMFNCGCGALGCEISIKSWQRGPLRTPVWQSDLFAACLHCQGRGSASCPRRRPALRASAGAPSGDLEPTQGGASPSGDLEPTQGGAGTREEPGTLTQGSPVFPGSSRLGIEPKTPGWLVQDPTTRPIGDLIPTIGGSGVHPGRGWDP